MLNSILTRVNPSLGLLTEPFFCTCKMLERLKSFLNGSSSSSDGVSSVQ